MGDFTESFKYCRFCTKLTWELSLRKFGLHIHKMEDSQSLTESVTWFGWYMGISDNDISDIY